MSLKTKGSNVENDHEVTTGLLGPRSRKPPKRFIEGYQVVYVPMRFVKSKVCIINHPDMLKHKSVTIADEIPDRVRQIMQTLEDDGVLKRCDLVKSQAATLKEVLAVHDGTYVKSFPNQKSADTFTNYFGEVFFSKGTRRAAFLAAGSVIQGCKLVLDGPCDAAFAVVRPPGHHALPSYADGFCILNNVSIGAKYLQSRGLKRILVVDIDVHHGNGTQQIFYESKEVLVISIHSSKLTYPRDLGEQMNRSEQCIGAGDGLGFNVNINLDSEYTDADIFYVLKKVLLPLASEFKPEITLISAGYDALTDDTLGDDLLSQKAIATFIHKLKQINTARVVLSLEGGYDIKGTAQGVSATVRALLGDPDVLIPDADLEKAEPRPLTLETVMKVQGVLSSTNQWESFP